jgi:LPS sulfotransferase NodH
MNFPHTIFKLKSAFFKALWLRPFFRLKIKVKYFFKCKAGIKKNPVFIVGSPRSGTSLLADYLKNLPEISLAGEVLNGNFLYGIRAKYATRDETLKHIRYSIFNKHRKTVVVKLFFFYFRLYKFEIDEINKMFPNAIYIIIYRSSIADQYVSWETAKKTNIYNVQYKLDFNKRKITIDKNDFIAFIKNEKNDYNNLINKDWIQKKSIIISYEELSQNPQSVFNKKIFPFLDIPNKSIKTKLRKLNPESLKNRVDNYESVKNLINEEAIQRYE